MEGENGNDMELADQQYLDQVFLVTTKVRVGSLRSQQQAETMKVLFLWLDTKFC